MAKDLALCLAVAMLCLVPDGTVRSAALWGAQPCLTP